MRSSKEAKKRSTKLSSQIPHNKRAHWPEELSRWKPTPNIFSSVPPAIEPALGKIEWMYALPGSATESGQSPKSKNITPIETIFWRGPVRVRGTHTEMKSQQNINTHTGFLGALEEAAVSFAIKTHQRASMKTESTRPYLRSNGCELRVNAVLGFQPCTRIARRRESGIRAATSGWEYTRLSPAAAHISYLGIHPTESCRRSHLLPVPTQTNLFRRASIGEPRQWLVF